MNFVVSPGQDTALMNRQLTAFPAEILKAISGVTILYTLPYDKLLGDFHKLGLTAAGSYLVISLLVTLYYYFQFLAERSVASPATGPKEG